MMRAFLLALCLALSSAFMIPARAPARAAVRMDDKDKKATADVGSDENWKQDKSGREQKPNFGGGSFADYLKAQQEKKAAEGK